MNQARVATLLRSIADLLDDDQADEDAPVLPLEALASRPKKRRDDARRPKSSPHPEAARLIERLILAHGTQARAATRLGVTAKMLSSWRRGDHWPSAESLELLRSGVALLERQEGEEDDAEGPAPSAGAGAAA